MDSPINSSNGEDQSRNDSQSVSQDDGELGLPELIISGTKLDTESIEEYKPGGLHPVMYGDVLDSRFEVISKLGHGGFGTVWLCLESSEEDALTGAANFKWRAVKVIRADASTIMRESHPDLKMKEYLEEKGLTAADWEKHHISLPLEHFWIQGPNGEHLCEVSEVRGPSIIDRWESRMSPERAALLKHLLYGAGEALQYLHSHGICHGDVTPHNVLLRLNGIEKMSRSEMIAVLEERGSSLLVERVTLEASDSPHAPKSVYEPVDLSSLPVLDDPVLIDFGASFRVSDNPDDPIAETPFAYAAPEAFFKTKQGPYTDVWSFACTVLMVVTQSTIFSDQGGIYAPAYYQAVLGPVPVDIYEEMKEYNEDEGFEEYTEEARKVMKAIRDETGQDDTILAWVSKERAFPEYEKDPGSDKFRVKEIVQQLPQDQAALLADLLKKIFKYDPAERIDIDAVLAHDFFIGRAASEAAEQSSISQFLKKLESNLLYPPSKPVDIPGRGVGGGGATGPIGSGLSDRSSPFRDDPSDDEEPRRRGSGHLGPSPLVGDDESDASRGSREASEEPTSGTDPDSGADSGWEPLSATSNPPPFWRIERGLGAWRAFLQRQFRAVLSWRPVWDDWFHILVALVVVIMLWLALFFLLVHARMGAKSQPHGHRDALLVPVNVRSSTTPLYFRGMLGFSVSQDEQNANSSCTCYAAKGFN